MNEPHRDPLPLVIRMAKDWTNPAVVRDAPDRVPHVIEQLIGYLKQADAALARVRALVEEWRRDVAYRRRVRDVESAAILEVRIAELDAALAGPPASEPPP